MKYRKKPVVIEAIRLSVETLDEVRRFISEDGKITAAYTGNMIEVGIPTLEGTMIARTGDYIIRGVNGELYPCKPDIFEKTYEPVKEDKTK